MKKFFSVICAVLLLIPMRVSAADTITFTPPFSYGNGRERLEISPFRTPLTIN